MNIRSVWVGAAGSTTGFGIIRTIRGVWGDQVRIIAADINPPHLLAASTLTSEVEQVPYAIDPDFPSILANRFAALGVDTYVPVHDDEVLIAARCRDQGRLGKHILVAAASVDAVERCNDKMLTFASLRIAGINTPLTVTLDQAEWRQGGWFIKPRVGVGSVGTRLLTRIEEFEQVRAIGGDFVLQSPCAGMEITIDAFKSRARNFFHAVARERIEIKAGVCSKARFFPSPELESLAQNVASALGLTGAFNVQVMRDDLGNWSVIDVNPRTGGGTSMSIPLGMQFAAANIADLWGENVEHLLPRLNQEHFVIRQPIEFMTR